MTNNVLKSHNLFWMIILCPSIKITAILRTYATWQYIMCWLIQADLTLMTFRPNLGIKNQYSKKLGPSAMLQAIRMCLRPTVISRDNTPRSLISLGCASGINFTLGIIPILSLLMTVGRKHILMARSVAEGPISFKY